MARIMFDGDSHTINEMHVEGNGAEIMATLGAAVTLIITEMAHNDRMMASELWDMFVQMLAENKDSVLDRRDWADALTS